MSAKTAAKPGFLLSPSFKNDNSSKGFQLTFANGWTVSVQFGNCNYCENRDHGWPAKKQEQSSPDAEIAAWDAKGEWYSFENDTVKGWCSPDEVAAFITKVSSFPKVEV